MKTFFETGVRKGDKILFIRVNQIVPNPNQPRKEFEAFALDELARSIEENGILQPLTVRKNDVGGYELISGERRLRAAKMAGLAEVPCILVRVDEEQSSLLALLENLQRKDLNYFEEAEGICALLMNYRLTQTEVAARLGKKQSTVANKLRLLKIPENQRKIIYQNHLTERHARALLSIRDDEERMQLIYEVIKRNLNVSGTEWLVERQLNESPEKEQEREKNIPKRVTLIKDIRVFFNTINHAIEMMKNSGIEVETQKEDGEEYIAYVLKIAKEKQCV